jgi:hypothetical protein
VYSFIRTCTGATRFNQEYSCIRGCTLPTRVLWLGTGLMQAIFSGFFSLRGAAARSEPGCRKAALARCYSP